VNQVPLHDPLLGGSCHAAGAGTVPEGLREREAWYRSLVSATGIPVDTDVVIMVLRLSDLHPRTTRVASHAKQGSKRRGLFHKDSPKTVMSQAKMAQCHHRFPTLAAGSNPGPKPASALR
jgi:hypothetical protein